MPFNCTFPFSLFSNNFRILESEFVYTLSLAAVVQAWAAPAVGTLAVRVDKYRRALRVILWGCHISVALALLSPHLC